MVGSGYSAGGNGKPAWLLLVKGVPALNVSLFFGDTPVKEALFGGRPVWDGIWPACVGTLYLVCLTVALALFPGIGCGIYLAEYAGPRQKQWLGCAIDVLAGIPSIVMGLFGFTLILFLRYTFFPQANTGLLLAAVCWRCSFTLCCTDFSRSADGASGGAEADLLRSGI